MYECSFCFPKTQKCFMKKVSRSAQLFVSYLHNKVVILRLKKLLRAHGFPIKNRELQEKLIPVENLKERRRKLEKVKTKNGVIRVLHTTFKKKRKKRLITTYNLLLLLYYVSTHTQTLLSTSFFSKLTSMEIIRV